MSFAMNLRRGSAVEANEPSFGASSAQADCVAFVADPETHGAVAQVCQIHFPGLQVHQGGTKEAVDYLAAGAPPKILIVDVSDANNPLSAMLPIIAAFAEDTRVIAIGAVNDIELYREMIEAGISDYLVKPIGEKALTVAIERAQQRKAVAAAAPDVEAKVVADTGKRSLVAVMGTRGGVGASTLAMNLGWLMANEHKRDTMLVDLDLQGGTIALALDVEPSHGLRDAIRLYTMVQQVAPSARVIFVANRDGGREGTVSKAEFEKALGKPIQLVLPEDAKANQAAANAGKPVVAAAAGSKMSSALKTLAKSLVAAADGAKKQKKSFWSLSRK
jgi:Flp pilus assembly CpaE family ATPase